MGMNKILLYITLVPAIFGCSTSERLNYHAQLENYRRDSSTWDLDMFNNDLAFDSAFQSFPFHAGVFPSPRYSLYSPKPFRGVGCGYDEIETDHGFELHSYFYFNEMTKDSVSPHIFFEIFTFSQSIDAVNYSHVHNEIISRNHPDYIGQGRMIADGRTIDYMAFTAHTGETFAVVNMRLFNLKFGRKIIITVQPDGSLRSRQE